MKPNFIRSFSQRERRSRYIRAKSADDNRHWCHRKKLCYRQGRKIAVALPGRLKIFQTDDHRACGSNGLKHLAVDRETAAEPFEHSIEPNQDNRTTTRRFAAQKQRRIAC